MNEETAKIIKKLQLEPLQREGGWFRQTWSGSKSETSKRPAGTAIYFLITPENFSALHQLATDEIWHYYAGDPVELVQLDTNTRAIHKALLGPDVLLEQRPQILVQAGHWQGARLAQEEKGWALLGCTMTPGWDAQSFTLGQRNQLLKHFPQASAEIQGLTR